MIKNKMSEREKIRFLLGTLQELINAWNHCEDISKSKSEFFMFEVKKDIQSAINKYMGFMQEEFKEENKGE